jgi:6-phospho-3-hexuloisomerase
MTGHLVDDLHTRCATAVAEIGAILAGVVERDVAALEERLRTADQIVTYGVGREGLVMRSLAMRLFHLGLPVAVTGDMTAPHLGTGGLFVTSAGPGDFATVRALIDTARSAGGAVALFTAAPDAPLAARADSVVLLRAQTLSGGPPSAQLMGSVYEQALWVLCDTVVARLASSLGRDSRELAARHTNLE